MVPPADLQLPFGHLVREKSIPFRAGRDCWLVEQVHVDYRYTKSHPKWDSTDRYALFRKNGRFVRVAAIRQKPFVEIHQLRFGQPWPVISVRGMYGLGEHWDTVFFTVRNEKLVEMGRPPAMNSRGPVLWHDRSDVWLFDNYDRYAQMEKGFQLKWVLMKVGKDGRLRRLSILKPGRNQVRETIPNETG